MTVTRRIPRRARTRSIAARLERGWPPPANLTADEARTAYPLWRARQAAAIAVTATGPR